MNLRSFKLIAFIWTRSMCQMQATFPRVEFLRILFRFKKLKKRKENSSSPVHVLHKTAIRRFHVVVVQWTPKKWTKKRDTRAELFFLVFLKLSLWVVVVVAKLPIFRYLATAGVNTWQNLESQLWIKKMSINYVQLIVNLASVESREKVPDLS